MDNYQPTKFCKYCGEKIPVQAVICPRCGGQVEELKTDDPPVTINNQNTNVNSNINANFNTNTNWNEGYAEGYPMGYYSRPINKWVAFILCLFLGVLGAHKFYEGRIGMGVLYLFTAGLFGIGWIVDIILILTKPNPYYIY